MATYVHYTTHRHGGFVENARADRWRVLCEIACPVPRRVDVWPGSFLDAQFAEFQFHNRRVAASPPATLSQSSCQSAPRFEDPGSRYRGCWDEPPQENWTNHPFMGNL